MHYKAAALLAASLLVAACGASQITPGALNGSGVEKTESRSVDAFDSVVVAVPGARVELASGFPQTLSVSADDNLLSNLQATVSGGVLTLSSARSFSTKLGTRFGITAATVKSVTISNAAAVDVMNVKTDTFSIRAETAAMVGAQGITRHLDLSLGTAAKVNASRLQAAEASVSLRLGSIAEVFVTDAITGSVEGGSTLTLGGAPASNTLKTSLGGTVLQGPATMTEPSPPPPGSTSPPATMTQEEALAKIRSTVTQARPIMVLNAVPESWVAELSVDSSFFSVTFHEPSGPKAIGLTIAPATPRPAGEHGVDTYPNFHGDQASVYQVADSTDPTSPRGLLWTETGSWSGWSKPGVPYLLAGSGLTDAEFWEFANSLHPNQV